MNTTQHDLNTRGTWADRHPVLRRVLTYAVGVCCGLVLLYFMQVLGGGAKSGAPASP